MPSSYTIGDHFEALIDDLVERGRFESADDVVQAGLRLIERQERDAKLEALRAEIQKGLDSGPAEEFDPHTLAEDIKRRGRQRLAAEKLAADKNG